LAVALIFGIADAGQIRLQPFFPQIPYQFFIILPYVLALVALAGSAKSASLPAALAQPYRKA